MTALSAVTTQAPHVAVIGGGFTGLSAAYELVKSGVRVTLFEADVEFGGLAGSFAVAGVKLEKFYHHWFTSDRDILALIGEIGREDAIVWRSSTTGMYYANKIFKLTSPLDLIRFDALSFRDRIRLGELALRARRVRDWKRLEGLTAEEWLTALGGRRVFEVVWEPLLRGKFGEDWREVSAVWIWNKIKLRGGSRGRHGAETLGYFRGGFAALAEALAGELAAAGAALKTDFPVRGLVVRDGRVTAVNTARGSFEADAVLATSAPAQIAEVIEGSGDFPLPLDDYLARLREIKYLANVCVVLELDRQLSETYWMNVNDPDFPFVAVIEHTNFEPPETYAGRHITYLSKYLPASDPLYRLSDDELFAFCVPHLKRMFPDFSEDWVVGHHVWRARYAQPFVDRDYARKIPDFESPLPGLYVCTMAQVYPEDRGTNYAVREGRKAGRRLAAILKRGERHCGRGCNRMPKTGFSADAP